MFRGFFAFGQEDFVGTADQVLAFVFEPRLALSHFVPDATEGVVGQELDDVAGREELVADGQFAAVARRLRGVPHRFAFFFGVEVLVDPADRFVFAPELIDLGIVDLDPSNSRQDRFARKQSTLWTEAIEQHRQIDGEFVKQAEQVLLIGGSRLAQAVVQQRAGRVEILWTGCPLRPIR